MKVKLKDGYITDLVKMCIEEQDKGICDNILSESLSSEDKNDVGVIVKKEIKNFLDINRSSDFENKIRKIVVQELKGKENENIIVEITKNVLTQLYKSLWMKKNYWTSDLKNIKN